MATDIEFRFIVHPIQIKTYEKSLASLRGQYDFDIIGDESVTPGQFRLEDYSSDRRFYPMFGIVDPEKAMNNPNSCMNPPRFMNKECEKGRCHYWNTCIFQRKGQK